MISEPSKDEKHLRHRILSWCGDHKMKLAFLFVVAILFGGAIYHVEKEDTFEITVNLEPERVKINERMSLTVEIIPLEHVKGEFEIEIKPENPNYIFFLESSAIFNSEKQSWIIKLGKLDLKVGMNWPYIYYLSGRTERSASTWKIDVYVRYMPEGSPENIEEHHEVRYFTVEQSEFKPPSFWDKVRQWLRRNTGHCLGTDIIFLFVLSGGIVLLRKRKKD